MAAAPRLSIAGTPPKGLGVASCRGRDPRLVVAIGSESETGFDRGYALADPLLRALVLAAAERALARGYREIIAGLRAIASGWRTLDDDERLPLMTTIVASVRDDAIELSWVGNDKGYLVRAGRVIAETREHTPWRMRGEPQGYPCRTIARAGCEPESARFEHVAPGDRLILISSGLHTRVGWRAGVEEALARVDEPDASSLRRALCQVARARDPEVSLEWSGPLVVVAL